MVRSSALYKTTTLVLGALLGGFIFASPAWADRVVYFDTMGHSEMYAGARPAPAFRAYSVYNPANFNDTGDSPYQAKCLVTITNSSSAEQKIDVEFHADVPTGSLSGTPTINLNGSDTTANLASVSGVSLGENLSKVMTAKFEALKYQALEADQDIHCYGKITVRDADATAPGFVTANGLMITWMQNLTPTSQSNTQSMRVQVNLINTPFVIGEGRAF